MSILGALSSAVRDGATPDPAEGRAPASGGPTNKQIIDAARDAYAAYKGAVDAVTVALVNSVLDPELRGALATVDGTNWASPGVPETVVAPFFASAELETALGVARTTDLRGASVGVFAKKLPDGGPGMPGFARDLVGTGSAGVTLSLDIFSGIVEVDPQRNLQYGLWTKAPGELHDTVLGFYVASSIRNVGMNLKILLTAALAPYGFVASTGATVPLPNGVFAGATAQRSA